MLKEHGKRYTGFTHIKDGQRKSGQTILILV
jgi:hypothetical protein